WRTQTGAEDRKVIVTNTTYQIAPWADVLYAMDLDWWRMYLNRLNFPGVKATCHSALRGVRPYPIKHYGNSGAGAIALASHLGAKRVILLGYDAQKTGGKAHWHGNHPRGLKNAGNADHWPRMFGELRREMPELEIINCSRE